MKTLRPAPAPHLPQAPPPHPRPPQVFWRELKEQHPYTARCYRELGSASLRSGQLAEAGNNLQQVRALGHCASNHQQVHVGGGLGSAGTEHSWHP